MTSEIKLDEMTEGYLDGLDDFREALPETLSNRSARYKHGWLNGRDDRLHKPRDTATSLRAAADKAERQDELPEGWPEPLSWVKS